jgi:hypothetical protein
MEWQPIETAPKDVDRILIADAGAVEVGEWVPWTTYVSDLQAGWRDAKYEDGDEWGSKRTFDQNKRQPTHWMPLPSPPKCAECA